jgi:hypothetical protein
VINFTITIQGTAPLLMHNARLSDPIDPVTREAKKISAKQRKTDEDHLELARLEHAGGLYLDEDAGPYIPSDNIWRSLYDAAKKYKSGPKVKEGIMFTTDVNPLIYNGPRTVEGLWADANFRHRASVVVDRKRVTRTRPMFRQWVTDAQGILDPNILDLETLAMFADTAGSLIGLGDWRPRYGKYAATIERTAK